MREIFRLCAEGYGKARIAKHLNDRGALAPRPKYGRPRGWAPSSVSGILYRDTYRGGVVWNRDAAHHRLAATRKTYLRQQNGLLWGRPPSGIASKYLLTGIARCGYCGGGLEMRSCATTGRRRLIYYSCSSHYRKGKAICPNKIEIPMAAADAAVIEALLDDVLTPDRLARVAERAVELVRAEKAAEPNLRGNLERQLSEAETALGRLTAAVAAGGDVPTLGWRRSNGTTASGSR